MHKSSRSLPCFRIKCSVNLKYSGLVKRLILANGVLVKGGILAELLKSHRTLHSKQYLKEKVSFLKFSFLPLSAKFFT